MYLTKRYKVQKLRKCRIHLVNKGRKGCLRLTIQHNSKAALVKKNWWLREIGTTRQISKDLNRKLKNHLKNLKRKVLLKKLKSLKSILKYQKTMLWSKNYQNKRNQYGLQKLTWDPRRSHHLNRFLRKEMRKQLINK